MCVAVITVSQTVVLRLIAALEWSWFGVPTKFSRDHCLEISHQLISPCDSYVTDIWRLLWSHKNHCIVMSHQMKLQWSHLITVIGLTFENSTVKSPWNFFCEKSPHKSIFKSLCIRHKATILVTFKWEF